MPIAQCRTGARQPAGGSSVSVVQSAVLVMCIAVGACIVLLRDELLGARFFSDGYHIQAIARGEVSDQGDASYGMTAFLYRAMGMADAPVVAAFFGYCAFVGLVIIVFGAMRTQERRWLDILAISIGFIFGAVYLGFYSKDVFVLAVVAALLIRSQKLIVDGAVLGIILLYGLHFRQYWLLVGGLYIFYRIYYRRKRSMLSVSILSVIVIVGLSAAIYLTSGTAPDYFRVSVNAGRLLSSDAATMIKPFISVGEPISGTVNNILTFSTLVLPVPLLLMGGAYYVLLFLCITILWGTVIVAARRLVATSDNRNLEALMGIRAWSLLTAFLTVQSLFEPDYGSAIRHLTPLIPLIFIVIWGSREKVTSRLPVQPKTDYTRSGT